MERELQPNACRMSDVGPDIRWVGNEKGIAADPCWATITPEGEHGGEGMPGDIKESVNNSGTRFGKFWMPAECDVSIRPGWFWHEAENSKVKTPKELYELYLVSVGRGASLLLNVPPDRRGQLNEADTASLRAFGKNQRTIFSRNLAASAQVEASNTRRGFGAGHLVDGIRSSYWATEDGNTRPTVSLKLQKPVTFDLVRLREETSLGQRIGGFAIDYWDGGDWKSFGTGTSVGMAKLVRATTAVTTDRVKLRITDGAAAVALSEMALFKS